MTADIKFFLIVERKAGAALYADGVLNCRSRFCGFPGNGSGFRCRDISIRRLKCVKLAQRLLVLLVSRLDLVPVERIGLVLDRFVLTVSSRFFFFVLLLFFLVGENSRDDYSCQQHKINQHRPHGADIRTRIVFVVSGSDTERTDESQDSENNCSGPGGTLALTSVRDPLCFGIDLFALCHELMVLVRERYDFVELREIF